MATKTRDSFQMMKGFLIMENVQLNESEDNNIMKFLYTHQFVIIIHTESILFHMSALLPCSTKLNYFKQIQKAFIKTTGF